MFVLLVLAACGGSDGDPASRGTADTGASAIAEPPGLTWPLDCVVDDERCYSPLGYSDIDGDGVAWDCGPPGYTGHTGVDIGFSDATMDAGIGVLAAADGVVELVFDGYHDRCHIDVDHPECQDPGSSWGEPGGASGFRRCTDLSPDYCGLGSEPYYSCFWCFDGGNQIVILHPDSPDIFATVYGHLQSGSVTVAPGEPVRAGQRIANAAASGRVTGPHLHFEVLGPAGWYDLTDPWSGDCSAPGDEDYLWQYDPPWADRLE